MCVLWAQFTLSTRVFCLLMQGRLPVHPTPVVQPRPQTSTSSSSVVTVRSHAHSKQRTQPSPLTSRGRLQPIGAADIGQASLEQSRPHRVGAPGGFDGGQLSRRSSAATVAKETGSEGVSDSSGVHPLPPLV